MVYIGANFSQAFYQVIINCCIFSISADSIPSIFCSVLNHFHKLIDYRVNCELRVNLID